MKMRSVLAITIILFSASCSNLFERPEVAECERYILSHIPNPDSYRRGRHDSLSLKEYWQVGIEYSYIDDDGRVVTNAWQTCNYPIADGEADISRFLNLQGSED
jgi:hypothetical protein